MSCYIHCICSTLFTFCLFAGTFWAFHSLAIRCITGNTRCRLRSHKCKSTHRPDVTAFHTDDNCIYTNTLNIRQEIHTQNSHKKHSAAKFEMNETIKTKIEKNSKWSHRIGPKINDFSFRLLFRRTWYGDDYGDMHAHTCTSTHIFYLILLVHWSQISMHAIRPLLQCKHNFGVQFRSVRFAWALVR